MKHLLAAAALAAVATAAMADDKKDAPKANADKKADAPKKESGGASLKVGDPAPALRASKWLQGSEVTGFAPGKVYVVEFWATWCGPCIAMMPHMGELQSEYRGKGVTMIGFTAKDPNNTAEKVAAFVDKRGPKLGYTFAYADDRDTYDAWMKAAGQNGIPCSFVVDPKGKVAYVGHPMYLDEVLPKVVAGSWKPEEGSAELAETEKELTALFGKLGGRDAEASLKALADFDAKHPALSHIPYFAGPKLELLVKAKKFDEAGKQADAMIARASERGDTFALRAVAGAFVSPEAKEEKALTARSLKAADELVKLSGDKDVIALLTAAEANFSAGNKEKAKEFGQKAVEAAAGESDQMRQAVAQRVKKYGVEKKEEDKKEDKQ